MHTSHHPQSLHHPHADVAPDIRPLIEFTDFCYAYDATPTLSHIDLTIDAGKGTPDEIAEEIIKRTGFAGENRRGQQK